MVRRFFRLLGDMLTSGVHERLAGLESRLDDLRAHSSQVEAKVDYLITLVSAQRQETENGFAEVRSRVEELGSRARELAARVEHLSGSAQELAENDGVLLQSAIHLVEAVGDKGKSAL